MKVGKNVPSCLNQVVQYRDEEKCIICVTVNICIVMLKYVVQNRQEIEIILKSTPGEHYAWVGQVNRIHLLMETLDDIFIICYVCWVLQWLLEKQLFVKVSRYEFRVSTISLLGFTSECV